MNNMQKNISRPFGKNMYLLGKDADGTKYYLKEASWDCDWYWGFGCVVSYGKKRGMVDLLSHNHWDSSVVGEKRNKDGSYCHNPFESSFFSETTFTKKEGWKLGELLKQYYSLRDAADLFVTGSAGITSLDKKICENHEMAKIINEKMMPDIFKSIYKILSPMEKTK